MLERYIFISLVLTITVTNLPNVANAQSNEDPNTAIQNVQVDPVLNRNLCAAAARGTWEEIEGYITGTAGISIADALSSTVCNVGNHTIGETLDGTMLHMAVHRNVYFATILQGITEALLGTVSTPRADPLKRDVFVNIVLGTGSHVNIFEQFRINHREEASKRKTIDHLVKYLCNVIAYLEIDELAATRVAECAKPPWDFLE